MVTTKHGALAVEAAFEARPVLIAYLMGGFPTIEDSLECIDEAISAGAGIIELGVPFSDPVADGKMIQRAGEKALENGMTLATSIQLVAKIRETHSTPILIMTYLNPLLKYGVARFMDDAEGIDGLIIPDLIPDESEPIARAAVERGLALVFLAAPNADESRIAEVASASTGFIYALGLEGVTGERGEISSSIGPLVARLRKCSGKKPIAVGFGVSTREHFRAIADVADGVIVGSAIVRRSGESPSAVGAFVKELLS